MFSIIMPVWNRAKLVERAIHSVLNQTYEDYELIIVDDGSEDGTGEVVRPFLSEQVRYYRIPHSGVSAARNSGLKQAKGNFIAYLDSDNVWYPAFLESMHQALKETGGRYKAVFCIALVYEKLPDGQYFLSLVRSGPFNYRTLLEKSYIDLNAFVHARECVKHTGLFDENLRRLVDWDFIMRLTSRFEPLFVPKVLVDYYHGAAENAISLKEDFQAALKTIQVKNKHLGSPVRVVHDTLTYAWKTLSTEKYYNWLRMSNPVMDTKGFWAPGFPFMVQIEPTNRCNLQCPLCPSGRNELNRERRHMTLQEFRQFVDDMERYLLPLVLWDWGEPFLNPDLPEMIRYATTKNIGRVTSTNARLLNNPSYVKAILKGGLSTLIVAIDSVCDVNYEAYRQRGKLDKALAGLQNLVETKRRLGAKKTIVVRMVVMRQNEHEVDQVRDLARRVGADRFMVKTANPTCGLTHYDAVVVPQNPRYRRFQYKEGTYERIRVQSTCRYIWYTTNIHSNGNVVPCCYHFDGPSKIGNIFETPLSQLWNSPAYREARRRIYSQKDDDRRCRECGINFKFSEAGMFVESTILSAPTKPLARSA